MTVALQATTTGPGLSLPSAGVRPSVSEREGLDLSRVSAGSSFHVHPSSFANHSPYPCHELQPREAGAAGGQGSDDGDGSALLHFFAEHFQQRVVGAEMAEA